MSIVVEILLISFTCMGLFTISTGGMVLEPIRDWFDSNLPTKGFFRWLYTPIWGCPICYSSFWGTILHFKFSGITDDSVKYWLPVILSVAFCNKILLSIKEKLEN